LSCWLEDFKKKRGEGRRRPNVCKNHQREKGERGKGRKKGAGNQFQVPAWKVMNLLEKMQTEEGGKMIASEPKKT